MRWMISTWALIWTMWCGAALAEPLDRATMAALVAPPFILGGPINDKGVWHLLNAGGAEAGYIFETGTLIRQSDEGNEVTFDSLTTLPSVGQ